MVSFLRAPLSWTNYLPKTLPPYTTTSGAGISTYEFWTSKLRPRSLLCHIAAGIYFLRAVATQSISSSTVSPMRAHIHFDHCWFPMSSIVPRTPWARPCGKSDRCRWSCEQCKSSLPQSHSAFFLHLLPQRVSMPGCLGKIHQGIKQA
jgi:hypothetical protein